jgi:hypothetical protein
VQESWESGKEGGEDASDGELQEAQLSVSAAEKEGVWSKQNNLWQTLLQVGNWCLPGSLGTINLHGRY